MIMRFVAFLLLQQLLLQGSQLDRCHFYPWSQRVVASASLVLDLGQDLKLATDVQNNEDTTQGPQFPGT